MSFLDLEAGRRNGYANGRKDPTRAMSAGIFQINTAVSSFQRLVKTLGTPKDTPELREKLHKTRLHIEQLVKDTADKLKQASDIDHHVEVSANKKITDAKLAKDFQAVLKEFQKAQWLSVERETACTPFVPQAVLPSSDTDVSADKIPEQRALLMESRRQEVLLLDNEISFNESIIEEREQGIQEIQEQIGEVNETFKDLAVLVHGQGTMMADIGSLTEGSHAATAQGNSQLLEADKMLKSDSFLTSLLYCILKIFVTLFVIVFDTKQGTMTDDIGSHIEGSHAATAQRNSQLLKAPEMQKSNSSLTYLLLVIFGIVFLIVPIVVIVLAA